MVTACAQSVNRALWRRRDGPSPGRRHAKYEQRVGGNRVPGRERSASTFASRREADRAWARAEADAAAGHSIDLRWPKTTFAAYVTGTWLPHHQLEASTRQRYGYQIDRHLI